MVVIDQVIRSKPVEHSTLGDLPYDLIHESRRDACRSAHEVRAKDNGDIQQPAKDEKPVVPLNEVRADRAKRAMYRVAEAKAV